MKKRDAELDVIEKNFMHFFNKENACNRCGMCCKVYGIGLTHDDLNKEPKLTQVSRSIKQSERGRYNINDKCCKMINAIDNGWKCPFYKDSSGCNIYETRPEICRKYIPTLSNCLKARMIYSGFIIESWYRCNVTTYCQMQLHQNTGLNSFNDYKAVFIYSLIIPYLVSEKKLGSYQESRRQRTLIDPWNIEQFIDIDSEIPDCIREYLKLGENYKVINDIFKPHALDAVLMG